MGLSAALKNTATRAQHGGFAGRSALSQRLARPTTPLGTENDCPAVGFRRNSRQTACHLGNVCWYRSTYPDVDLLGMDPAEHYLRVGKALGRRPSGSERRLKRIVLAVVDVTTIGGIPSRTKRLLSHRHGRPVDYIALTARADGNVDSELFDTTHGAR